MRNPVFGGMAAVGITFARMPQRVAEQRQLPVVEVIGSVQKQLHVAYLARLALEVDMQLLDSPLDRLQLMEQEVGCVAVVRLGQ
ncbi:MAG TPA: hypothetical protein VFW38_09445 [Solirubrobacteraceae bacterium]|nr:hypothetical protein [Solirubrobacteraceae bacterium]